MPSEFEFDFSSEARETNRDLAGKIAKLSPLTELEVNRLLPDPVDQSRLMELIRLVNSAAERNTKIAALSGNIENLGGVILTLVTKYLKPL